MFVPALNFVFLQNCSRKNKSPANIVSVMSDKNTVTYCVRSSNITSKLIIDILYIHYVMPHNLNKSFLLT